MRASSLLVRVRIEINAYETGMLASFEARTAVTCVRRPPERLWTETRAGAGGRLNADADVAMDALRYVLQSEVIGRDVSNVVLAEYAPVPTLFVARTLTV